MSWPGEQQRKRDCLQAAPLFEAIHQQVLQLHKVRVRSQNLAVACRYERLRRVRP